MALLELVHWAKATGWLTIYIPNARQWTHGQFWEAHPLKPGSMAQTDLAYNFLLSLGKANEEALQRVPLRHELDLGDDIVGLPSIGKPFPSSHSSTLLLLIAPGCFVGPQHGHSIADLLELVPRFNAPGKDEAPGTMAVSVRSFTNTNPRWLICAFFQVDPYIIGIAEHAHRELCEQTECATIKRMCFGLRARNNFPLLAPQLHRFPMLVAIDQFNYLFDQSGGYGRT
jgi:hypothetical protein